MREILLENAIDHFGRLGFEGAATREIARASGTAMSSITYHFSGKEGLYVAAAEHIAEGIRAFHAPVLDAAKQQAAGSREEAIEGLLAMLDNFAIMMLSDRSRGWSRFIIREQQHPTQAFDRIFEIAMRPLIETFAQLIATARADLSQREARATGFFLFGQALALRAARASMCRLLDLDTVTTSDEQFLRERLRANARAVLEMQPETSA